MTNQTITNTVDNILAELCNPAKIITMSQTSGDKHFRYYNSELRITATRCVATNRMTLMNMNTGEGYEYWNGAEFIADLEAMVAQNTGETV